MTESTGFTPDQLQAAAGTVQAPPVATGPDPDALAAKVATGVPGETDVRELLAQMQAQQNAMAAEIARLRAGGDPSGLHPLAGTAAAAREQLTVHLTHNNLLNSPPHAAALRLADDLVDAAGNAVESGDVSQVRDIGGRLERALKRIHPGNGDNHYYRQAVEFVRDHLPDAADTVTAPTPSSAPAVASSQPPARVVAGSVTG
jgi:hypothetical protein